MSRQRALSLLASPLRYETLTLTAEQFRGAATDEGRLAVPGPSTAAEKKSRRKRTPAERRTDPYEWEIQRSIVVGLRRLLAPGYIVHATRNERQHSVDKIWSHAQGAEPGWPDLEVCGDSDRYLIEIKDGSGVLSDSQKTLHPRLIAAGQKLLPICRSLDEAIAWLRDNGAKFREFR